ncbi:MAG: UvrD-helicase domain-containing protein, partial [Bacilli bacterium]|nr:UvrD-helicase domain-containing protein [Bacilli bacterium]
MGFTEYQEVAKEPKQGNFLVSASAGSGKTAVLTQRVFEIISQGKAKLNELLVLTFTNFAAQEMRQRIRDLLIDNNQHKLAASVEAVAIQTYDAFAYSLVKKYH